MTPREARQAIAISDAEMARWMGVHYMTWRKWATGERPAGASTRRLIALLVWMHEHHPEILEEAIGDLGPRASTRVPSRHPSVQRPENIFA